MGRAIVTLRDFSRETSNIDVDIVPVNAGNLAAQSTALGTFITALQGVTRGVVARRVLVAEDVDVSSAIPTDENSQVEWKWLVRGRDTVNGKAYTRSIPCADPTGRLVTGTDRMSFEVGQDANIAFRTALEAFVRSVDGNTIAVEEVIIKGR